MSSPSISSDWIWVVQTFAEIADLTAFHNFSRIILIFFNQTETVAFIRLSDMRSHLIESLSEPNFKAFLRRKFLCVIRALKLKNLTHSLEWDNA